MINIIEKKNNKMGKIFRRILQQYSIYCSFTLLYE